MESPPAKQSYDRSLQTFVLSTTTLANIALIVFFALVAVFNIGVQARIWLSYIIVPIALAGIIYNFFIWPRLEARNPYGSTYISLGFVALACGAAVVFTGGLNSSLYPLIPLLVLLSCILGWRACITSSVLAGLLYALLEILSLVVNHQFVLHAPQLFYTVFAIIFGLLVAKAIDHYVQTAHMASTITNQLDSTQLSEKLMLSAIADPVIGVNKRLEIILFNSAAETMTGWDYQSAQGVEFSTVVKLKDQSDAPMTKSTNPFNQVFEKKTQITTDRFHLLDKNNAKQSYSIAVAPTFNMENQINGAIAVFHNISEQKAVQRERNEFVSTASHEMRTPVAAIEGYLSMASNPNLATVDARAKNFIDKAHDSAIHLGKLFQDLLSVTKIEDQRLQERRQVFNMTDLVSQVAAEEEVVAQKKGLTFLTHIGSANAGAELVVAPLYQVNADPERIREVLTNLIDNAIKYTKQGSVEITLTGDKSNVRFSVRDTGIGIPPEEQKHMFEKFYRVTNSMTRETGGTGLGLYIARSLIELYGGRIWVESKPGEGSTFYFSLPLVKS